MESATEKQFKERRARSVFRFNDGTRDRKVDAWRVFLEIRDSFPLALVHANAASAADVSGLVAKVRSILSIPAWSEENEAGLNDTETVTVLRELMDFVEGQKKSTADEPT